MKLFPQGVTQTPNEARRTVAQLLDQLQVAHRRGIVHRDIRPSNIICFEDNRVRLGDWGCAGRLSAQGTSRGSVVGVLRWQSDRCVKASRKHVFFDHTIFDDLESLAYVYHELSGECGPTFCSAALFHSRFIALGISCLSSNLHMMLKQRASALISSMS